MAHSSELAPPIGFIAGAAITANRLVKGDSTAGQVVVTSAITDIALGVALATVANGEQVSVGTVRGAKYKLTASAAISLNAQVMPTASGSGKISTAAGATAQSIGIALEAAAADGDIITVLFLGGVNGPANS